jgi:hypothetical protein
MEHQTVLYIISVFGFLLAQVVGSWKILSNIKEANNNNTTGLEVIKVHIKSLDEQIKKQNGRLGKLEEKHEELNNSVIAHHSTYHPCK